MKNEAYKRLCEDVKKCRICENIYFYPHVKDSNRFVSGTYLKEKCLLSQLDEKPYVNLWNSSEGMGNDLDAEIMIIGQDYGKVDSTFPTDENLKKLTKVFVDENKSINPKFFYTNIANCYREHSSTGEINTGCLAVCANKFIGRLINIICPKVIIVLGKETFRALAFCDGAKLVCNNPVETSENIFKRIVERDYELVFEDKKIAVFPVFHPGANGRRNRTEDEQNKDWGKIKGYLREKGVFEYDKE